MTTKPTYRGTTLSCPTCHESYVALGLTPDAEQAAARRGPTCCPPTPHDAADLGKAARREDQPRVLRGDVRHLVTGVALYVGVPCAWLGFVAALVLHR